MPAEVLIADPSFDWIKSALPFVMQEDLATSHEVVTYFAKSPSAAYEGQGNIALRTVIEDWNGKIRLEAVLTDSDTQRNKQVITLEANSPAGLLSAMNQMAKQINPQAATFPTNNLSALQAFTAAAVTQDLPERLRLLDNAVEADPSFGLAHIAAVETAAQAAPQRLSSLITAASLQQVRFAPLQRARWNLLIARYHHATSVQQSAAAKAVLEIAPHDVDALASLGVNEFLQNKGQDGERDLRRAVELSPGNTNIQLQLAIGLIESRKFSESVTVLKSLAGTAAAVPILATALLLQGNEAEATKVFQSLVQLLPRDSPQALFLNAQWQAITTRKSPIVNLPQTASMSGYNAFLNGRFQESAQFWRTIVQQTGETDLRARVMLFASLQASGQNAEASKVIVLPFVPDFGDAGIAIAFNQMRQTLRL